jgi:hypothetical protein
VHDTVGRAQEEERLWLRCILVVDSVCCPCLSITASSLHSDLLALLNFVLVYSNGKFSRSTPEDPGLSELISFIMEDVDSLHEAIQAMDEDLIEATLVRGA